ncbi:MAG: hypothetical protein JNJ95_01160 [Dechloromonas sp.]|nr:hypothetical protein [Dechloromonas sp.]
MTNPFAKLPSITKQQADNALDLLGTSLDNTQQIFEFQTASIRQFMGFFASHSEQLLSTQSTSLDLQPISAAVREFGQIWGEYMQGGKALTVEFQRQAQEALEAQTRMLGAAITDSVAEIKAPHPAGKEILDMTLRSWTSATEKSFEQVNAWQKNLETASDMGGKALAALTAQAARTATAKRRNNAVAA